MVAVAMKRGALLGHCVLIFYVSILRTGKLIFEAELEEVVPVAIFEWFDRSRRSYLHSVQYLV